MKTIIVDQSSWRNIALVGPDRVRFLHSMCCGNIETLAVGSWLRTVAMNHKARVLSIFDVHAMEDHLLISCPLELGDATYEALDKHIVADDVELEERNVPMHTIWADIESVWTSPPVLAKTENGSSDDDIECRRIEAGLPRYGVDVSEANFPFETPLVRLVDYDKGCFLGQEPVSRVRARGGATKQLCGLCVATSSLLSAGDELFFEGKKVGVVTSSTRSETFGNIALGYVNKHAWEPDTVVEVSQTTASVVELPFSQ